MANASVEADLQSLLAYFGEAGDSSSSSEGSNPEEFFTLVLSFSSALQVGHCVARYRLCLTLHFTNRKRQNKLPNYPSSSLLDRQRRLQCRCQVSISYVTLRVSLQTLNLTFSAFLPLQAQSPVDAPQSGSKTRSSSNQSRLQVPGERSVGRGDFDDALRSIRTGKRRDRNAPTLGKTFFDGTRV